MEEKFYDEDESNFVNSENLRNTKETQKTLWERVEHPQINHIPVSDVDNCETPLEYFKKFFSEDLLKEICLQSNLYSCTKYPNQPLGLTPIEFEQWLGIFILMSITRILNSRLHWSSFAFNDEISSIMTRKRWEEIRLNLHLGDNTTISQNDELSKVRLLIDHLRSKFNKIPMLENLCVDEQIVPFKGGFTTKQYIENKPHKWGYKIFILADNEGLIYDFFPFTGTIPGIDRFDVPDLGVGSNPVLQLCEVIPDHKDHKIYFDNWLTSFKLVDHLATRRIWASGTIQACPLPSLSSKNDKQLENPGCGIFDEQQINSQGFIQSVMKQLDNTAVCLSSSFLTSEPTLSFRKYDKVAKTFADVSVPNIISEYNKNITGVDQHSQQSYYRMSFRSKKYYIRLIFHLIDMTIVNSWKLLQRKEAKRKVDYSKRISLNEFKKKLSQSLMFSNKDIPKKRWFPSEESVQEQYEKKKKLSNATKPLPEKATRTDGTEHWPSFHKTRGTCKYPGCSAKKYMYCMKCQVHLCCDREKNCFLAFHKH